MTEPFELLIEKNAPRLRNICRSYADREEQDDLFQEVLEQLWRSQNSFRGDALADTWLYRVAINTAVSYQRKKIHQRKVKTSAQSSADSKPSIETQGLSHEEIMRSFSQSLNPADHSIFVLYVSGLTTEQMSEVIGLSGNAIKVRISRMKTSFRQQFVD